MKFHHVRKHSVLDQDSSPEHLYTFKNFPIFMGCVTSSPSTDIVADMIWDICPKTGLIQLKKLLSPSLLYPQQHCEVIGRTWKNHHYALVRFIEKFTPKQVLEIGGASGFTAKRYLSRHQQTNWTIIEPNPMCQSQANLQVIQGWFDHRFTPHISPDAIIHSHVFEHIYHPHSFLSHIHKTLPPAGLHIFSIPNLRIFLKNKYTNGLNFEHTLYLEEDFVDYLLLTHGFKILDKKYYLNHSIFYATQKYAPANIAPPQKYKLNKRLFQNYVNYHQQDVDHLNQLMADYPHPVFLFGAHIFSIHMLVMGLNQSKIVSVLDNNQNKQGKRLYGTKLKVQSPSVLSQHPKAAVILRAGHYNQEIKSDIIKNINKNVLFW